MMLLKGSSKSGARGASNRSRGSRGRGTTSRGASNSSSKSQIPDNLHRGPKALQGISKTSRGNYRGGNFKTSYSKYKTTGSVSPSALSSNPSNSFEQERLENAAKREQKGLNRTATRGGRGATRSLQANKQVRFTSADQKFNKVPSSAPSTSVSFGAPAAKEPESSDTKPSFNPFAKPESTSMNPFTKPDSTLANPFAKAPSNPFAAFPETPSNNGIFNTPSGTSTVFGKPSETTNSVPATSASRIFGAPSGSIQSSPFSAPTSQKNEALNGFPGFSSRQPPAQAFENPSQNSSANGISGGSTSTMSVFGKPSESPQLNPEEQVSTIFGTSSGPINPTLFNAAPKSSVFGAPTSHTNGFPTQLHAEPAHQTLPSPSFASSSRLSTKMDQFLRKDGIIAPAWPPTPGDPKQRSAMEAFWQTSKGYRSKVRASLIKGGYLDDPNKPKKLSEAIDFKGTCEEMCPEFEKITRIVEHDVQGPEKEVAPDGSLWPSPRKMVKALARSAAGQDAPLPMDVRSPAALRRTLDYLIHTVLGDEGDLPSIHGFLWDRTRAIRRDFVFQSSMNATELADQVYCLERITRFHVIALHQMSKTGIIAEDFSEQQEVEQLGKALLSLIHAYEDSKAQGIICENESEFRAYYVLFNGRNSGILETVQDWGWEFWGKSAEIKIATSLVETLQNIWDSVGPLKPHSEMDLAQNAYSRFFSIIEDKQVSYIMACFAEIYFNTVRKSALKTILASYRKRRDQTKDWTLSKLNTYLRFDDESHIVEFGEAYGLRFEEVDGEEYLSFDGEDQISDPFPPLKQRHSYDLVERKRGQCSLPEVIDNTVFEEEIEVDENEVDEGLFVDAELPSTQEDEDESELNEHLTPQPDVVTEESYRISATQPEIEVPQPSIQKSMFQSAAPKPDNEDLKPPVFFGFQQSSASATPAAAPQPASIPKSIFQNSASKPNNEKSPISFGLQQSSAPAAPIVAPAPAVTSILFEPAFPAKVPSLSESHMPGIAKWYALADGGLFDQFMEYNVAEIVRTTAAQFVKDEDLRIEREIAEAARNEADRFRHRFLGTKYFYMWREAAHNKWMKRQGREARKARREMAERLRVQAELEEADRFRYRSLATKYFYQWREAARNKWMRRQGREARKARREMAESRRAFKAIDSANIVQDFRASISRKRRGSLESLLDATGVLNGVHNRDEEIRAIFQNRNVESTSKKRKSSRSTNSPNPSHKRGKSDNPLRRSLLSDPSYLTGGSRIHFMSNYGLEDENRPQVSGVKTDYFRLKARGISTLPDGTPLASSAANHILHEKQSFDGISKPSTPKTRKDMPAPRSVPTKHISEPDVPRTSAERDAEIQALKARARTVMSEDARTRQKQKRSLEEDNDEELFARAKRIREQMDEGAQWYRKEIGRHSMSRSIS